MIDQNTERKLDCDKGHDLCYCAGRAECHNCGQPLPDDYIKEPLTNPEKGKSNDS